MSAHSILVTGGCGLIGSNVVRELNAQGLTDILIVDRLASSPHKWKTLSSLRFADYMDADTFAADGFRKGYAVMKGVKTVIHCGACSATTQTDVSYLMRNNYDFSQWLAIWAGEHGARFVYASSAATYGADTAMDDVNESSDYLDALRPLNPYGMSKALFDRWMVREGRFSEAYPAAIGLKYTNIFGYSERHKGDMRSVVCKAYDSLHAREPIQLFESANPAIKTSEIRRDFLHVSDAAKVTAWAALGGIRRTGIFNVGSGQSTSFVDLATYTAEAFASHLPSINRDEFYVMGKEHSVTSGGGMKTKNVQIRFPFIQYTPMPLRLRSRYQYVTCAPITKLRDVYTEPFIPLKDAITRYVGELAKEDLT